MSDDKDPEYPDLRKDLEALSPDAPGQTAIMMLMGNSSLRQARELRDNPTSRRPMVANGYSIAFDTKHGVVGLWSGWLRDSFFLGWPSSWLKLSAQTVAEAFPSSKIGGRWRPDYQRVVGDVTLRLSNGEETSIEIDRHVSHMYDFCVLRGTAIFRGGRLPHVSYGWGPSARLEFDSRYYNPQPTELLSFDTGNRIASEPFWRTESPEDERLDARDLWFNAQEHGFMRLACDLANMDEPAAVTIKYMTPMTPEVLSHALGFELTWILGEPGRRKGWGQDAVYGVRGDESVMLVSANEMVPWVTYRRVPLTAAATPKKLRELLTF